MDDSPHATPPAAFPVLEIGYLGGFRCCPRQCLSLCCDRYALVAVDEATVARCTRSAPELLSWFRSDGQGTRMALRDGRCVALRDQRCEIHLRHGSVVQPDICHFFPRRLHRLGNSLRATATLSCSLVLRRALVADADPSWHEVEWTRLPSVLPDLLEQHLPGLALAEALELHERFVRLVDERPAPEAAATILVMAGLLDGRSPQEWPATLESHLPRLDRDTLASLGESIPPAGLLAMLGGLARAPHHREFGLLVRDALTLVQEGLPTMGSRPAAPSLEPFLRRYLKARLRECLFPLAPWGTCLDEAWLLAVSFLVLRLGLRARPNRDATTAAAGVECWLHGRRQEIHDRARSLGWLSLQRVTPLLLAD